MGTSMSNLGQVFVQSGDILRTEVTGTLHAIMTGSTEGYSEMGDEFERLGGRLAGTFTNSDNPYSHYSSTGPPTPEPLGALSGSNPDWSAVKGYSGNVSGNNVYSMGGTTSSAANMARASSYGGQSGLGGTTPPSYINKISDPGTKMAMSASNGRMRAAFNTGTAVSDTGSANTLASVVKPNFASSN